MSVNQEQNPFLMLITNYDEAKSLAELEAYSAAAKFPECFSKVILTPAYLMDEKRLNYTFATDKWVDSKNVSLSELRSHLPKSIQMSPRAKRVAVWDRILRALHRPVSYVATTDERAFFLTPSGMSSNLDYYLVTIDFKNKVWACSSPEYTGKSAERFVLDKHIISALIYYRNELLERAATPLEREEWQESYNKCSCTPDLQANWVYFFIKKFVPKMQLRAGYYANLSEVNKIVNYLVSKI
jgi:hypothetical protein